MATAEVVTAPTSHLYPFVNQAHVLVNHSYSLINPLKEAKPITDQPVSLISWGASNASQCALTPRCEFLGPRNRPPLYAPH